MPVVVSAGFAAVGALIEYRPLRTANLSLAISPSLRAAPTSVLVVSIEPNLVLRTAIPFIILIETQITADISILESLTSSAAGEGVVVSLATRAALVIDVFLTRRTAEPAPSVDLPRVAADPTAAVDLPNRTAPVVVDVMGGGGTASIASVPSLETGCAADVFDDASPVLRTAGPVDDLVAVGRSRVRCPYE